MTTPRRQRPPRQADVARLAGVSQSAVSLVIRGESGRIPDSTRQRIQEAIAELGYVPNPVARNLRGQRTRLLGVHTFEPLFASARESFYFEFLLGIEERAEETGHDLVLFSSTGDGAGGRHIYRNESNRLGIADGSVLLGMSPDRDQLARLWREGYPFVHIGRREVPGADFPCIVPDYRRASFEIVEHLYARGHRGLVYLADVIDIEPYHDRRAGYREALRTFDVVDDSPATIHGETGLPVQALDQLLRGERTAVVAESQRIAETLRRELAARGLSIPGDVSVTVLEDTTAGSLRWDDLRIPRKDIGRIAIDQLVAMIGDPEKGRASVLVPCELVPGETIAAPPSRSRA